MKKCDLLALTGGASVNLHGGPMDLLTLRSSSAMVLSKTVDKSVGPPCRLEKGTCQYCSAHNVKKTVENGRGLLGRGGVNRQGHDCFLYS